MCLCVPACVSMCRSELCHGICHLMVSVTVQHYTNRHAYCVAYLILWKVVLFGKEEYGGFSVFSVFRGP